MESRYEVVNGRVEVRGWKELFDKNVRDLHRLEAENERAADDENGSGSQD